MHKAVADFGILAHDVGNTELFNKIPINQNEKIEIRLGAGEMSKVKDIQDIPAIQDDYFEKYKLLENIKKYDFSNNGKNQECEILKTMYNWLQRNNDNGFCIRGYDVKKHLQTFCKNYNNATPYKDSYVLMYSEKNNVILYVDTAPIDIKKSMRDNRLNIINFRSANQCLDEIPFIYLPITLCNPKELEILDNILCKKCVDMGLVVSYEKFKDLKSFDS